MATLAFVLALSGAGPCAEDQTPVQNPATTSEDEQVTVALDADGDGRPDDSEHQATVTKAALVRCSVAGACAYFAQSWCAGPAAWQCLQELGLVSK